MSFTSFRNIPPDGRRRIGGAARVFCAVGLLAVAGCGFQPIHAQRSQAGPEALAQIEIELISDRIGQILRNELLQRFHPRGNGRGSRFSLATSVTESLQDLGIKKDTVATRANLTLTANFSISALADGELLFKGTAQSTISYNILTSDFATLSAREDARRRGAREIADQIKQWASVWLAQTGGKSVKSRLPPEPRDEAVPLPGGSTSGFIVTPTAPAGR